MQLFRVVVAWSGPPVKGNAVSVLHFDGSNQTAPPVAAIKDAYTALAPALPFNVTCTIPTTGDIIEDTTGALVGVWNGTGGGPVVGSAQAPSAAGVGACVTWNTGGIVQGKKGPRKLRGRTFIVPINNSSFENDGTLMPATLSTLEAFASSLQGAGPLAVWHRPYPAGTATGGSYGVLSHVIHDKVAILTSRRD